MKNETHIRRAIRQMIRESGYGRRKWYTTTKMGLDEGDISDLPEIPIGSKESAAMNKAVTGLSKSDYDLLQSLAGDIGDDPADQYFASLKKGRFRDMMREFARAYVEELLHAGGSELTDNDVLFLQSTLDDVQELDQITEMDTFRVWAQAGLNKIYKNKTGKREL